MQHHTLLCSIYTTQLYCRMSTFQYFIAVCLSIEPVKHVIAVRVTEEVVLSKELCVLPTFVGWRGASMPD